MDMLSIAGKVDKWYTFFSHVLKKSVITIYIFIEKYIKNNWNVMKPRTNSVNSDRGSCVSLAQSLNPARNETIWNDF